MTPAQHKAEAETRIAALNSGGNEANLMTDTDLLAMYAHARLGKAAGTGTNYTTADSLLATYDTQRANGANALSTVRRTAATAFANALLAD